MCKGCGQGGLESNLRGVCGGMERVLYVCFLSFIAYDVVSFLLLLYVFSFVCFFLDVFPVLLSITITGADEVARSWGQANMPFASLLKYVVFPLAIFNLLNLYGESTSAADKWDGGP